ncbi:nucleotidyltransferase domain-containing protein [Synechococcus sp. WH 8016]|uniref:nucleotidyltransferase domain-containing protein n=1 Tax=Synechococcus sp. WH 8016 TaxID=166318 RepID=UPI00022D7F6C|nr:nucleotidyltransferase domain-containing protein [Synechococcus sp. WH 8016]EHA58649.1 DNA polymerase beta domain protein region [Synechococcus sp. WH 8016]
MHATGTTTKNAVAAIRERKREERVQALRSKASSLLSHFDGCSLWLFGFLARGDWDAFSDVDVLAVGRDQECADRLSDQVLACGMADDVIALTVQEWQKLRQGHDPYWRAIAVDSVCLGDR